MATTVQRTGPGGELAVGCLSPSPETQSADNHSVPLPARESQTNGDKDSRSLTDSITLSRRQSDAHRCSERLTAHAADKRGLSLTAIWTGVRP